ncbi:MAG: penicillin acylase family protein, partial [Polyangiales bacterium]
LPSFLGFDPGPIPIRGGRATPHQGQIYRAGDRLTSFAPSLRLVADMSTDVLHTAMCGGPSDRRFSKWYKSGVRGWLAGELKVRNAPT